MTQTTLWSDHGQREQTISEARKEHLARIGEEGESLCPCCGVTSRVYRRKLSSQMAAFLFALFHHRAAREGNPVHVRDVMVAGHKASSDGTYLAHWGLISAAGRGEWRITPKGMAFVKGRISTPMYVLLLNNEVQGFAEEVTTMRQALADPFAYDELMAEVRREGVFTWPA